jgi:hypothetical protein
MSITLDYNTINMQDRLLAFKVINYFNTTKNFERVEKFITRESAISLRDLEAFVTKYAAIHGLWYYHEGTEYVLHERYKAALTSYNKGLLDPFRRTQRVDIKFKEKNIETTIGQLNFLRFLIDSKALDWLEKNYSKIRIELQQLKNTKTRKKN